MRGFRQHLGDSESYSMKLFGKMVKHMVEQMQAAGSVQIRVNRNKHADECNATFVKEDKQEFALYCKNKGMLNADYLNEHGDWTTNFLGNACKQILCHDVEVLERDTAFDVRDCIHFSSIHENH